MSILAFCLALVIFLTVLSAIPVEFRVTYRRIRQDDAVVVQLAGFFGLWKYRLEIPILDWNWAVPPHLKLKTETKPPAGDEHKVKEEIKPRKLRFPSIVGRFFKLLAQTLETWRWFYKGIRCKHLRWIMEVGCEDAACTGLAVGGVWSIMGYYLGKLHNRISFQVQEPKLAVYPAFQKSRLRVDFDCIFNLRIGHIIIAGFKMLRIVKILLRG